MALAFGYGAHAGFGLAFLNFFGTILFFLFMLLAIKVLFKGLRYSGNESSGYWREHIRKRYRAWITGREPLAHQTDEAMAIARYRLATSELSPEEFLIIKQGLSARQASKKGSYQKYDDALTNARIRFAKADISLDEFEAVLKALS